MAIIKSACSCGEKVTVRTGNDAKTRGTKNQVVYTGEEDKYAPLTYDIWRCRKCLKLIRETCSEAA